MEPCRWHIPHSIAFSVRDQPSAFLVKIGLVELQKFSYAVTQDSPRRALTGHTRTLEVEQLFCGKSLRDEHVRIQFYEVP